MFEEHTETWIPDSWKISHAATTDREISTSWKGKDGVVLSSVYKNSRGPLIYVDGVELEEGKKHFLSFSVSHDDEGSWDLIAVINDREQIREAINKGSCVEGWKEFKIDISDLMGSEVYAEICQEYNELKNHA